MIKKCCKTCRFWGDAVNNNVCCKITEHATMNASHKAGIFVENDCKTGTQIVLVTTPEFMCNEWKKALLSNIKYRKHLEKEFKVKIPTKVTKPRWSNELLLTIPKR